MITRRPEIERTKIVWVIWNENGRCLRLDSIYEDADEAREFIKGKPYLRGESWALICADEDEEEVA